MCPIALLPLLLPTGWNRYSWSFCHPIGTQSNTLGMGAINKNNRTKRQKESGFLITVELPRQYLTTNL